MVDFMKEIQKRKDILNTIDKDMINKMYEISELLVATIKRGNKVFTAGNGGSAANAQHITGDIVGRFKKERRGFAGISLTCEPSVITAISNDYSYDVAFARQLEGLGKEGDVVILLSSSGNSMNLINAAEKAKEMNIVTVGILGNNGGKLRDMVDYLISIPEKASDLAEEFAMSISHIMLMKMEEDLCNLIERGEFI